MPLHLLGKKSWNVYNAANIARVRADEEAATARETADEQRMQEIDAARRAAILRGQTPPPLPEETDDKDGARNRNRDDRGHERKRRKLAGEDDTDMDIRLAASTTASSSAADEDSRILRLRNTKIDAPLTDHAGNIDLFPVDMQEAIKREKNAEVEKEKWRKERAFEDLYTMRFSNAAGRDGLERPWYASQQMPAVTQPGEDAAALEYPGFESKNVWGNEDPRRKEREQARITSNDPFAFMQQAQAQLKRSKEDKKKWAVERDRELQEMRAIQEREERKKKHQKRTRTDDASERYSPDLDHHGDGSRSAKHKDSHGRERRRRSRDRSHTDRHDRRGRRSRSRERGSSRHHKHSSSRTAQDERHKDARDEKHAGGRRH